MSNGYRRVWTISTPSPRSLRSSIGMLLSRFDHHFIRLHTPASSLPARRDIKLSCPYRKASNLLSEGVLPLLLRPHLSISAPSEYPGRVSIKHENLWKLWKTQLGTMKSTVENLETTTPGKKDTGGSCKYCYYYHPFVT